MEGRAGIGPGGREVVLHEEARVHGEAGGEEDLVDGACVVEEKLGLDALDAGGVSEELEEVLKEGSGGGEGLGGVGADGPGVSDDRLVALVNAEGEAADAATVEGDEAGKDARIEILEEKLGGALIVPAKTLLPDASLGFEERAELPGREVPEVEDLELGRDSHILDVFVELIGILVERRGCGSGKVTRLV